MVNNGRLDKDRSYLLGRLRINIKRNQLTPWLFMLPALLVLVGMAFYPMLLAIKLSFYRWELATIGKEVFIGFQNYAQMLTDSDLLQSLYFTIFYTVVGVSIEMVLGTLLAVLLNQSIKGMRYFSTILLSATALAPVAVGITWRFFMNTDYGTMSYLLRLFGIAKDQVWLAHTATARWVLVGIDAWWSIPFVMLVVLSGLKSLPTEPFESARMDGANSWQIFWYLSLPMLKPAFLVVLIFRTMDALRVYDLVYTLTFGGPGISTSSISFYIYQTGFRYNKMGYATAIGVVFLLFIIALTLFFVRILGDEFDL